MEKGFGENVIDFTKKLEMRKEKEKEGFEKIKADLRSLNELREKIEKQLNEIGGPETEEEILKEIDLEEVREKMEELGKEARRLKEKIEGPPKKEKKEGKLVIPKEKLETDLEKAENELMELEIEEREKEDKIKELSGAERVLAGIDLGGVRKKIIDKKLLVFSLRKKINELE